MTSSLASFLLQAVLISLAAVVSPGPIAAVTIGKGSRFPHAGAAVALGHGIVEFPLMVAILYGLGYLLNVVSVKAGIAFVGGVLLLAMGVGMFRAAKGGELPSASYHSSSVTAGILLSLSNPYFLIWWVTVGAALVLQSLKFGIFGFLIFAIAHWLCDFGWYTFLSILSYRGGRFFGRAFQRIVFIACGGFLLFLGGKYVMDAVRLFFP